VLAGIAGVLSELVSRAFSAAFAKLGTRQAWKNVPGLVNIQKTMENHHL